MQALFNRGTMERAIWLAIIVAALFGTWKVANYVRDFEAAKAEVVSLQAQLYAVKDAKTEAEVAKALLQEQNEQLKNSPLR